MTGAAHRSCPQASTHLEGQCRWRSGMSKYLPISFLLLFGSIAAPVYAQMGMAPGGGMMQFPGCPPGLAPGQPGCGGQIDDDAPPSRRTGPTNPSGPNHGDGWLRYETGRWEESYGAYADNGYGAKGAGGRSEDSRNAVAARKEALRDCGQPDCKIKVEVRNGCWAVAWGKRNAYYVGIEDVDMSPADPKTLGLKAVESKALGMCKKAGDVNCEVRNTSCSLPSP